MGKYFVQLGNTRDGPALVKVFRCIFENVVRNCVAIVKREMSGCFTEIVEGCAYCSFSC